MAYRPQRQDRHGNPHGPGLDDQVTEALLRTRKFLRTKSVSDDLRSLHQIGGRDADAFYRDRWSHDKVVRSTHGINCTGSCSWKVYVKDGIITWEAQQTDYFSPLLMGVVLQATGTYTTGFVLLAIVAAVTALYTVRAFTEFGRR